ncbi:MAG TPA: DUF4870 domain-containing protein [Candidatus Bathyarchaeia archaeon]|nr:DUF4870 domain-containing protein [Candidatus Bathyarchaeia archaeon]
MPEEVKSGSGLPRNTAAALSYVAGWVSGIIFLLLEKKDEFVRFHAMQAVITFGVLTILAIVPVIGWVLSPFVMILSFILWLVLIIKAWQGEKFELPIVAEFAKKQLKKIK